jgi:subtilisin family serine protease
VKRQTTWSRRTFAALLASGVAMGSVAFDGATSAVAAQPSADPGVAAAVEPATPKEAPADTLGSHDAELLTQAEAKGAKAVTLIISTDSGEASRRRSAVRKLAVRSPAASTGRLRARAGADRQRCSRPRSCPASPPIDLDETIKLPEPADAPGRAAAPQAGRRGGRARCRYTGREPVHATNEIGSVDFKQKHPTYDGRGVTIGIMDSGVDLDHPALQKTSTGARKIVDWVTATDPLTEGDGTWRAMRTEVTGPTVHVPRAHLEGAAGQLGSTASARHHAHDEAAGTSTGTATPPTRGASSTTR